MKIARSALEAWKDFERDQHELVQEMITYEEMLFDCEETYEDFWASLTRGRDEDNLDADDYGDLHAYYEYEDYYP